MSESHAVAPRRSPGDWASLLPRILEMIDQNPAHCTGPELFEDLCHEGLVTPDQRQRFLATMTYWRRTGRVGAETVSKNTIPPCRVNWSDHLPFLLDVIDGSSEVPTTTELFDALVKSGRAHPDQKGAFVNAATRMRAHGDLPTETAGPSGPPGDRGGRPWDLDPSRALGETGEVMARQLRLCVDHLNDLLRHQGTVKFTPSMLSRLGRSGFGVSLIGEAVAELTHRGVAVVGTSDGRLILGRVVSTHSYPASTHTSAGACVTVNA